jgi:hypothetical protein
VGRLELLPLTEIAMAEIDRGVDVELAQGELFVSVEQHAAKKLAVIAGRWSIRAELGRARIKREGADHLEVEVMSGAAEIVGPKHVRLHDGERFSTDEEVVRNEPPLDPSPSPPVRVEEHKHSKSRVHRTLARREARLPEPQPEPPVIAPEPQPTPAPAKEIKEETPSIPRVVEQPKVPAPSVIPQPETTEALYQRARSEQNPFKAMALFDQVVERNDPHAETASYLAARAAMIAHRCREAIDRIHRHEARWSNGTYAEELRLDVIECRIKLGELDAAGGDIESFLAFYPRSPRAADVSFLRAELHRKQGELRAAIADYEAALGGRHDADAIFFSAWCSLRIGDRSTAKSELERYLAKYPKGAHAKEAEEALAKIP